MPELELELATTQIPPDELDPEFRNSAINKVIIGFFRYRHEYSDEIPKEIIHSNSQDKGPLVKARKGCITGICCLFEDAIHLGLINEPNSIKRIKKVINKFTSEDFCNTNQPLTTESDIQEANTSLDFVISRIPPELINKALKPGIQFRLNIPFRFLNT